MVRFAVHVRTCKGVRSIGIVSADTAHAAAKLHAPALGIERNALKTLFMQAVRTPLVEHKGAGVAIWSVPIAG